MIYDTPGDSIDQWFCLLPNYLHFCYFDCATKYSTINFSTV